MKNKIFIKIRGGLGNQLFQYAFAERIHRIYPQKNVVLDVSYFNKKHIRSLELNQLKINKAVEWSNKRKFFFDFLYFLYRLFDSLLKHRIIFNKINLFGSHYLFCDKTVEGEIKKVNCKNIYMAGYFQDRKQMDLMHEYIRNIIQPYYISEVAKRFINIITKNKTIGVSIRVGNDYVKYGWPICSSNYYISGLNYLNNLKSKVIVFADVIEKVKNENWFRDFDVIYVEKCSVVESLFLLSLCDDFVISNSTFAWWGAYLSNNEKKKIVAPEMFYPEQKMIDSSLHIPGTVYLNNYTGAVRKEL